MAFDMKLDNFKEKINYHEEELFMVLENKKGFPNCNWLWQQFYSGPVISPTRCEAIANELETAKNIKSINSRKSLLDFIERVVPFFRKSYVSNKPIKCLSD